MSPEYNYHLRINAKNDQEATNLRDFMLRIIGVEEMNLITEESRRSEWLTPKEAAAYLRIHPKTVYRYVRSGHLQQYQAGGTGHPRFLLRDLEALFQEK